MRSVSSWGLGSLGVRDYQLYGRLLERLNRLFSIVRPRHILPASKVDVSVPLDAASATATIRTLCAAHPPLRPEVRRLFRCCYCFICELLFGSSPYASTVFRLKCRKKSFGQYFCDFDLPLGWHPAIYRARSLNFSDLSASIAGKWCRLPVTAI